MAARTPRGPEDTRMQTARLAAEAKKAQQDRAGELTMITAKQSADDLSGVYDPKDGSLLVSGLSEAQEAEIRRQQQIAEDVDEIIDDEDAVAPLEQHFVRTDGPQIGPNGVPIEPAMEMATDRVTEAVADFDERAPEIVEAVKQPVRKVVVRINADIDPTIGRGRTYHFLEGRRYSVSPDVAAHLHEKGYVSTFG